MSQLFKGIPIDETTPITHVGVYVTRWRPEWGEPSMGFIPAHEIEEELTSLHSAMDQAIEHLQNVCDHYSHEDVFLHKETAEILNNAYKWLSTHSKEAK